MGQGPKKQSMRFYPQAGPVPLLPPVDGSGLSQLAALCELTCFPIGSEMAC